MFIYSGCSLDIAFIDNFFLVPSSPGKLLRVTDLPSSVACGSKSRVCSRLILYTIVVLSYDEC